MAPSLSVKNRMSMVRILAYLSHAALRMLEVGEIQERVATLEELAKVKYDNSCFIVRANSISSYDCSIGKRL